MMMAHLGWKWGPLYTTAKAHGHEIVKTLVILTLRLYQIEFYVVTGIPVYFKDICAQVVKFLWSLFMWAFANNMLN